MRNIALEPSPSRVRPCYERPSFVLFAVTLATMANLCACSSSTEELGPCPVPTLPETLPSGTVDVAYDGKLGIERYTFQGTTATGLPAGLDPYLVGTPEAAGDFQVVVTVTGTTANGGACTTQSVSKAYALHVDDTPAVCDTSVDCAYLASAFGGGACTSSRACGADSACVAIRDGGRCHDNDPRVSCGSGTRRLRTVSTEGLPVETCVSDVERRKTCNARNHCVEGPLLSAGQPCDADVECSSNRCFAGTCN